jgi:probable HAF family extracellular repeat protein
MRIGGDHVAGWINRRRRYWFAASAGCVTEKFRGKLVTVLRLIAAGAFLTASAGIAHATCSFTTIADPLDNGYTVAQGINDAGQIVGYYQDAGGAQHGFLLSGGSYSTLNVPGAASTQANGINNAGQISGYSATGGGATTGFVRSGGSYVAFTVPGGTATNGWGINNAGTLSGYFSDATGSHGFVGNSGSFTTLDDPMGLAGSTVVHGINSAGHVVGTYTDAGGVSHGFIWSSSGFVTLDDPVGTLGTTIYGINDVGQVVGSYLDASGSNAFVESAGSFVTLNDPQAFVGSAVAYGINDLGQIVGSYVDSTTGEIRGFEAVLPEPASLAVLGFALAGLAAARRRQA